MENYKISVIICTYNRAEILKVALESLGRNQLFSNLEYQIVLVDDGSTDHTAEVAKEAKQTCLCDLDYYRIEHAGRSAARNKGIKECRGDYVLFVDDDIIAPPDLLNEHYEYHKKYPHSVIRGPIINVKEHRIPEGRETTWRDFSSAFFCTCNASVNKFALVAVGGFDEDFVEYGFEDNELGWRLRERNWVARFNMKAIVYHYKPIMKKDELKEMVQRAQELGRSAVAYYQKHPHWKVALATGLHPALKWWNKLQANEWYFNYCLKKWNESAETLPLEKRAHLEQRIFRYHYLNSLEEEKQRIAKLGAELDAKLKAVTERAQPGKVGGPGPGRRPGDGPNQGPQAEPNADPRSPRGGPVIGESGRIVNKNIRPNVHVQPKTPPGKSSDSPF